MAETPIIRETDFGASTDSRLSVALQEHEEEEALMRSAHDTAVTSHLGADQGDVLASNHSRVSSLSLPGSRQRTPLASRRTSEEIASELTPRAAPRSGAQGASPAKSRDGSARSSLEDRGMRPSTSFEKVRRQNGKRSFSDGETEADDIEVNGNGFVDEAPRQIPPRPRKAEGTAEKAGVILVGLTPAGRTRC